MSKDLREPLQISPIGQKEKGKSNNQKKKKNKKMKMPPPPPPEPLSIPMTTLTPKSPQSDSKQNPSENLNEGSRTPSIRTTASPSRNPYSLQVNMRFKSEAIT